VGGRAAIGVGCRLGAAIRSDKVTAAGPLCAQVTFVVSARREDVRHALGNANTVAPHRDHLIWIVGQQADHAETELAQHFRRREVDALVHVKAQLLVGVERVETGVRQLVGLPLVEETSAASLLGEVEQHPAARPCDRSDRSDRAA